MDVGTTATAVFATIGGSAAAKRTGWSHLVYNLMTGLVAFAAITPYMMLWQWLDPDRLGSDAQLVLVAFHTGFNLLGVVLVLPVADAFAQLMLRVVPEPEGGYTTRLDRSLLGEPALALDAVTATLLAEFSALTGHTRWLLDPIRQVRRVDLPTLQSALDETRDYADRIVLGPTGDGSRPLVDCFHILDHLQRLLERCEEDAVRARNARLAPSLTGEHHRLLDTLARVEASLAEERWADAEREALESSQALDASVQPLRQSIMERVASDRVEVAQAARELEALRWMSRVDEHVAKITMHLRRIREPIAAKEEGAA
jgi:phosphate:Na+ symporter